MAQWQADADFPIHYHQQPNGGKMRAHNRGARLATTPLFVCIDSDDILTDDAPDEAILAAFDACASNANIHFDLFLRDLDEEARWKDAIAPLPP